MFAVIKTGGKQYRVAGGQEITVEKLAGDVGAKLEFGEVLMIGDGDNINIGAPMIKGAKVTAYKKKPRNTYRRKLGHRQHQTVVRITDIVAK